MQSELDANCGQGWTVQRIQQVPSMRLAGAVNGFNVGDTTRLVADRALAYRII